MFRAINTTRFRILFIKVCFSLLSYFSNSVSLSVSLICKLKTSASHRKGESELRKLSWINLKVFELATETSLSADWKFVILLLIRIILYYFLSIDRVLSGSIFFKISSFLGNEIIDFVFIFVFVRFCLVSEKIQLRREKLIWNLTFSGLVA